MIWTEGYVSDVAYPAFFYREMQPCWLAAVAGFLGVRGFNPDLPFSLCELGCGVGTNLLVAAACHPQARFVGIDADAAHIRVAQEAAHTAGIGNVTFVHAGFATFAGVPGEMFDIITCHGVWSWIAAAHRNAILDIVTARLDPSGLLLLHYMCHPGSTDLLPVQHLLNLSAHHLPGPSAKRAKTGLALLRRLAAGGLYADRPAMLRHLARLEARAPADLAHEFLTDHWRPEHSADVHQHLGQEGLRFVGSADVFNNLDPALSIPGRLQPLIRATAAPALAETLKDMARDAHQRLDLFVKHPPRVNTGGIAPGDGARRFALLPGAPACGPIDFATPIGTVTGPDAVFTPLLRRLAEGSASLAELARLAPFGHDPAALASAVQLLMMQGFVHPVTDPPPQPARAAALQRWFDDRGVALTLIGQCGTAVTAG